MPSKRPNYRNDRLHSDFLTNLKFYFESSDQLRDLIIKSIQEDYTIENITLDEIEILYNNITNGQPIENFVRSKIENLNDITKVPL